MKKIFLLLLMIFNCLIGVAENYQMYIVITTKDGSKLEFALKEKPVVTFSETDLIVATNEMDVRYPLNDIIGYNFEEKDNASVNQIKENITPFIVDGDVISFPSIKQNTILSIYSLNGMLIHKKLFTQENEYSYSLTSLIPGVYILNLNDVSYKIVKK